MYSTNSFASLVYLQIPRLQATRLLAVRDYFYLTDPHRLYVYKLGSVCALYCASKYKKLKPVDC
jgi:hypothetical protein